MLAQNSEHSDKKSLTSQIQRQRRQCGVILQRITQRLHSFIADSIAYRHTRVRVSNTNSAKQFHWATLSAR
jgi:ABC-type sulfate/molybdate transport systems ATPase subunit